MNKNRKLNFGFIWNHFGFSIIFTTLFLISSLLLKLSGLSETEILDKYAIQYSDFWQFKTVWMLISMNFVIWNMHVFHGISILLVGLFAFNYYYGNKITILTFAIFSIIIALLQYFLIFKLMGIHNFNDAAPSNMLHAIITLLCLLQFRKNIFKLTLFALIFYNILDLYLLVIKNTGSGSPLPHLIGQIVGLITFLISKKYFKESRS